MDLSHVALPAVAWPLCSRKGCTCKIAPDAEHGQPPLVCLSHRFDEQHERRAVKRQSKRPTHRRKR